MSETKLTSEIRHYYIEVLKECLKMSYEDESNRTWAFICPNIGFSIERLKLVGIDPPNHQGHSEIEKWFEDQRPSEHQHSQYFDPDYETENHWWDGHEYEIRREFLKYLIGELENGDV